MSTYIIFRALASQITLHICVLVVAMFLLMVGLFMLSGQQVIQRSPEAGVSHSLLSWTSGEHRNKLCLVDRAS